MAKEKAALKEILRLLNYLQENDSNTDKLNPIIVFGKEKFEMRTINLCKDGEYISGNHNVGWEITIKGIEFLEEHKKTKRVEEHTKISNFLAAELVITTIAILFHSTKLISPKLLVIIYATFSVLLLIYFKKFKEIKL